MAEFSKKAKLLQYMATILLLMMCCAQSMEAVPSTGKMKVSTPPQYGYKPVDINLDNVSYVNFTVKACHDALVSLTSSESGSNTDNYEIVIGSLANSRSVIRRAQNGTAIAEYNHTPLDCNKARPFWISWADDKIRVGSGSTIGQSEFMSADQTDLYEVKAVAVSTGLGATGKWIFGNGSAYECPKSKLAIIYPEETTAKVSWEDPYGDLVNASLRQGFYIYSYILEDGTKCQFNVSVKDFYEIVDEPKRGVDGATIALICVSCFLLLVSLTQLTCFIRRYRRNHAAERVADDSTVTAHTDTTTVTFLKKTDEKIPVSSQSTHH